MKGKKGEPGEVVFSSGSGSGANGIPGATGPRGEQGEKVRNYEVLVRGSHRYCRILKKLFLYVMFFGFTANIF